MNDFHYEELAKGFLEKRLTRLYGWESGKACLVHLESDMRYMFWVDDVIRIMFQYSEGIQELSDARAIFDKVLTMMGLSPSLYGSGELYLDNGQPMDNSFLINNGVFINPLSGKMAVERENV